jgi:uncharacterized membrane protein (DUF485 family)
MDWEPWLHFAHIAGVVVWVGGGTALAAMGWRLRRSAEVPVLQSFAGTMSFVGLRLFLPAIVVVLLAGVGMVLVEGDDFTTAWILIGIVALVVSFLIGAVYLSRSAIRFDRLAKSGDVPGAQAALGSWLTGYLLVLAILVFTMWDMVFKPGT